MISSFRLFPLAFLVFLSLGTSVLFGLESSDAWTPLEVASKDEASAVALLEAKGLVALAWPNALVEVSAFESVELRPLARLETSLTPQDPRWDPWLMGLRPVFHPAAEVSRIWVETSHRDEAIALLGKQLLTSEAEAPLPRRITGWMLIAFSLLYVGLRLGAGLPAGAGSPWRWSWLALSLVVIAGGFWMTGTRSFAKPAPARIEASWLQHLWFQQSWPYGAQWKDWSPGTAWTYRTFERRDGKIVEARTALPTPDAAWANGAYAGLDPHHAARLFRPENP